MVCAPGTIDTLSLNCVRQISSSTFGCRKNGLPKRNVGPKPMPVSAARLRFDGRSRPALARVGEVRFVQHPRREGREPVQVDDVDARRIPLDAVRRRAVGRDVERLVLLPRVVEVPRRRDVVVAFATKSSLLSSATVSTGCSIGRASSCPMRELKNVEQRRALAVGVRVDERFVLLDRRVADRARGVAELPAQVRPLEVAGDPFERGEEERLVLLDRPAERAAPLLAVEVFEAACRPTGRRSALRAAGSGSRLPLRRVRPRLGDDVHHAAGRAAEFRRRAGGDHLEFLDRLRA